MIYEPARKVESEDEKVVRYERVIEKLRKMMDHERKLLKLSRAQYQKELQGKSELEVLLKQACDKVVHERKAHRKHAQQKVYINQTPGLGVVGQKNESGAEAEEELNQHERERVIELLLSQERVINLLYDKTFTMTSMGEGNNMGVAEDIENLKRARND